MIRRRRVGVAAISIAALFFACAGAAEASGDGSKPAKQARPISDRLTYAFTKWQWKDISEVTIVTNADKLGTQAPILTSTFKWSENPFLASACSIAEVQPMATENHNWSRTAPDCTKPSASSAYIFHIVYWKKDNNTKTYGIQTSDWYVYRKAGDQLKQASFGTSGESPIIDAKSDAFLIAIHIFDPINATDQKKVKLKYSASATKSTPQNLQDLAAVIAAVNGSTTAGTLTTQGVSPNKGTEPSSIQALVLVGFVRGLTHSPFTWAFMGNLTWGESNKASAVAPPVSIPGSDQPERQRPQISGQEDTEVVLTPAAEAIDSVKQGATLGALVPKSPNAGDDPPAKTKTDATGAAPSNPPDCTAIGAMNPTCSVSRSFTSIDREWWDVSLGITTPGFRQTQFSAPSGSVLATQTRHTEVFAFMNLGYDLQNRGLWLPHLDVGLPVSGQPFYSPFVGLGEWFTPITSLERRGFPLRMGVFAGAVFMQQYSPGTLSVGSPATAGQLKTDLKSYRVTKLMVGLEFSVKELVGRVKPRK